MWAQPRLAAVLGACRGNQILPLAAAWRVCIVTSDGVHVSGSGWSAHMHHSFCRKCEVLFGTLWAQQGSLQRTCPRGADIQGWGHLIAFSPQAPERGAPILPTLQLMQLADPFPIYAIQFTLVNISVYSYSAIYVCISICMTRYI